jgi:hypothetical protein
MTNKDTIREIVRTTIFNHPPECIFHPNALENILKNVDERNMNLHDVYFLDELGELIQAEEIYCPHEGIDKRNEK